MTVSPLTHDTYSLNIVVNTSAEYQHTKAIRLASQLDVSIEEDTGNAAHYNLVYTDNRIELQLNPLLYGKRFHPLYVDFFPEGKLHSRLRTRSLHNPLCRALGLKPGFRPSIIDATAGLGMDSLSLAMMGSHVTMIERSPIIHALLEDGLERAAAHAELAETIQQNVSLLHGNSIELFTNTELHAYSVLIDPMFPHAEKGPMNKKEMRMLRDIVGADSDAGLLTNAAFHAAEHRVAVKRPKGAESLSSLRQPDFITSMKSGRFDVYLTYDTSPQP